MVQHADYIQPPRQGRPPAIRRHTWAKAPVLRNRPVIAASAGIPCDRFACMPVCARRRLGDRSSMQPLHEICSRIRTRTQAARAVKPAPFAYVRAQSLAHVHELLARHGADAKLLAGGQSLVPALNMRLACPAVLIDINGLDRYAHIEHHADRVRIGALVRHTGIEHSPELARAAPLFTKAVAHVAHPAVRNRGSFGGSLALADPAAELPACCLALDATLIVAAAAGERRVRAVDFFRDMFETALGPQDVLLGAECMPAAPDEHCAFVEIARRHGDYASAGLAVKARIADGVASELRLAFFAIGRVPKLATTAAGCLTQRPLDRAALAQAKAALRHDLAPLSDLEHGVQTKMHLADVVLERALAELPLRRQ